MGWNIKFCCISLFNTNDYWIYIDSAMVLPCRSICRPSGLSKNCSRVMSTSLFNSIVQWRNMVKVESLKNIQNDWIHATFCFSSERLTSYWKLQTSINLQLCSNKSVDKNVTWKYCANNQFQTQWGCLSLWKRLIQPFIVHLPLFFFISSKVYGLGKDASCTKQMLQLHKLITRVWKFTTRDITLNPRICWLICTLIRILAALFQLDLNH